MSILRVLDHSGDTEVEWVVEDEVALKAARKLFNDMVKAGYIAYAIEQVGSRVVSSRVIGDRKTVKTILYKFYEQADEIVMTPMLRGG